jgi:hypothetical protein
MKSRRQYRNKTGKKRTHRNRKTRKQGGYPPNNGAEQERGRFRRPRPNINNEDEIRLRRERAYVRRHGYNYVLRPGELRREPNIVEEAAPRAPSPVRRAQSLPAIRQRPIPRPRPIPQPPVPQPRPLNFDPNKNINSLEILELPENASDSVSYEDIDFNRPVLTIDDEDLLNIKSRKVYQAPSSIEYLREHLTNPLRGANSRIFSTKWKKPVMRN